MAKMGRPTKYKPEYCKEIVDYFSIEHSRIVLREATNSKGETYTKEYEVANPLPLFKTFAGKIGVHIDTMLEWCKIHPDFSESYNKCKYLQEDMLNNNTLRNLYNAKYAQFLAKNITDMRDVKEVETRNLTQEKWLQIMSEANYNMKDVSKKREMIE